MNMKELRQKPSDANQFRIIAGTFRGRKISFDGHSSARPTPNRVRETVFNWLQPTLEGARCLDLFAGSGALGFEALSRGAKEVVFVDHDERLIESIRANVAKLDCSNVRLDCQSAYSWLESNNDVFDVVFLDPPYKAQMLDKLCTLLDSHQSIAHRGHCYLEMAAKDALPKLPKHWQVRREKRAGQVRYALVDIKFEHQSNE